MLQQVGQLESSHHKLEISQNEHILDRFADCDWFDFGFNLPLEFPILLSATCAMISTMFLSLLLLFSLEFDLNYYGSISTCFHTK
jgi:hypothetical protein